MSARSESDTVEILSGVFEGQTTGAPIALLVKNRDVHSGDYEALREKFCPATRISLTRRSTVSGTTGAAAGVGQGNGRPGREPGPWR